MKRINRENYADWVNKLIDCTVIAAWGMVAYAVIYLWSFVAVLYNM